MSMKWKKEGMEEGMERNTVNEWNGMKDRRTEMDQEWMKNK